MLADMWRGGCGCGVVVFAQVVEAEVEIGAEEGRPGVVV